MDKIVKDRLIPETAKLDRILASIQALGLRSGRPLTGTGGSRLTHSRFSHSSSEAGPIVCQ